MGLRIIIDHQLIEDDRFRYAQPILQESAEVQLMVVLVGQIEGESSFGVGK